jgi:hypothetical protein
MQGVTPLSRENATIYALTEPPTLKHNTMTVDVGMKNLAVMLFEHSETVSNVSDVRVVSAGVHDISASSV